MENKFKVAAIAYHNKGFSVIPLRPRDKLPIPLGWQKYCNTRSTLEEIELWWDQTPNANIGIACGPANVRSLFVVDQDVAKDENKKPILNEDGGFKQAGDISGCPITLSQTTGSGGKQLLYWAPKNFVVRNSKPRPLVDVRGDGGQVVVPPSIHPNGNGYSWDVVFNTDEITEFPEAELKKFLNQSDETKLPINKVLSGLPIGQGLRNIGIAQVAGYYLRNAKTPEEIEMARVATCAWDKEMNKSPEPVEKRRIEIDNTIKGILKQEIGSHKNEGRGAQNKSKAISICISSVKSQPIDWLWPGRFALGKLSLIAGDPGLGKSLLSTTLAAIVSKGNLWPVDNTPAPLGDVILLSAEDDPSDTIRPRLDGAGADCSRIHLLKAIKESNNSNEERERMFSLQRDVSALEEMLKTLPNCKLVVIDPVSAYLDGTDSHNNSDVRGVLAPLAGLAMRYGVAIILVHHLNKNGGSGNAIYRTMGSLAFTAAVRAAFIVTLDKGNDSRRLFLQTKNNIAKPPPGLAYTVNQGENESPVVVWEDQYVNISANDAIDNSGSDEDRTNTDWAIDFLLEVLSDGSKTVKEIYKEAHDLHIKEKALRSACERLGVERHKVGFKGGWVWNLPKGVEDAQSSEGDP